MMAFYTPTLLAIRLSDSPEFDEGGTGPLQIECVSIDDLAHPLPYVVKFKNKVSQNGVGIISEIISGHLANFFGIHIPDFALIDVSEPFARSVSSNVYNPPNVLEPVLQNRHAENFGSRLLTLGTSSALLVNNRPNGHNLEKLEDIFAFDALIYNADRSPMSPNMFALQDFYYIFDHEKAFAFLLSAPRTPPNDLRFLNNLGECFLQNHIFYLSLLHSGCSFSKFIGRLEKLDDGTINELTNQVPYELRADYPNEIQSIKAHLTFMRENSNGFQLALIGVIA